MVILTQERLKELLDYDPATGAFLWLVAPRGHQAGAVAGTILGNGYRHITINRRRYYAHRLAFLYMTGAWPVDHVDHVDLSHDNNSWDNLRPATRSQNLSNIGAKCSNRLGVKGVCVYRGRYHAQIMKNRKQIHLGYFDTIEGAAAAYANAANEFHGEFARVS